MTVPISSSEVANTASSRTGIETLARLIRDAFEGDPDHSLLANLRELREEDWTALPPSGGRTIADILEHVAWSKMFLRIEVYSCKSIPPCCQKIRGCPT